MFPGEKSDALVAGAGGDGMETRLWRRGGIFAWKTPMAPVRFFFSLKVNLLVVWVVFCGA